MKFQSSDLFNSTPHEAKSLLNRVTKPSLPCCVWASTVPPSCWTEQLYLYVLFTCWWISKMATVRPNSLSSSCSPSTVGSFSRGPLTFCLVQEKRTRGGNMAEATHSRNLFPSRRALDAAGYTLTTGFTTCLSEDDSSNKQNRHTHTVSSSLQHCTAFSSITDHYSTIYCDTVNVLWCKRIQISSYQYFNSVRQNSQK